ncbi:MAG: ribosomal protein large subunit ribosomal protein [Candidatus Berkelbacteria bacterium]|nr:ribosomal protein large subunit ribosomal protein [Candidatus Berkelbacteria bacterium]
MKLTRAQKEELVSEIIDGLKNAKTVVLVNYQGLKVKEIWDLKKKLREQGIGFQIIKNTLFKIALKKENIEVSDSLLDQPVALVWGLQDEVIPAKITVEFGKTAENLKVIGGIVNGSYVDEKQILLLAALPGREELYAKLVGTLNAPIYRLVNVLQGNLRSLVYILKQYQESKV